MRSIEFAGRSVRSIEQGTHQRHERRVTSGTFSRSLSDCCASLISGSRPDCPVRPHGPSTRTSAAVARRAHAADLGSDEQRNQWFRFVVKCHYVPSLSILSNLLLSGIS